jgi:hypothetical protein
MYKKNRLRASRGGRPHSVSVSRGKGAMAQLLAPRSARIGVPNATGYKRIVWHKPCADPRISLVMLRASPFRGIRCANARQTRSCQGKGKAENCACAAQVRNRRFRLRLRREGRCRGLPGFSSLLSHVSARNMRRPTPARSANLLDDFAYRASITGARWPQVPCLGGRWRRWKTQHLALGALDQRVDVIGP